MYRENLDVDYLLQDIALTNRRTAVMFIEMMNELKMDFDKMILPIAVVCAVLNAKPGEDQGRIAFAAGRYSVQVQQRLKNLLDIEAELDDDET